MLINVNHSHGTAKQLLVDAIANQIIFHTRTSADQGVAITHSELQTCPECRNRMYVVYSYTTRILELCQHCGYKTYDHQEYSKTTRTLQRSIEAAYLGLFQTGEQS